MYGMHMLQMSKYRTVDRRCKPMLAIYIRTFNITSNLLRVLLNVTI
jgi:hypothetical protein